MSDDIDYTAQGFMQSPVVTVHRDDVVASVATMMIDHNIGSVVVVDSEGNICGLVTERMFMPQEDFFPFMRGTVTRLMGTNVGSEHSTEYYDAIDQARSKRVHEVMESDPPIVHVDTTIDKVIDIMAKTGENHVPVVERGKPVGMIARHDLLRMFS